MQFYFKFIKLLVLLFLAREPHWPFLSEFGPPKWAPSPCCIKSTAGRTSRGAESGPSGHLLPSSLSARSRSQVRLLQSWDTSPLKPGQTVDVLDCPEKFCVCFGTSDSYSRSGLTTCSLLFQSIKESKRQHYLRIYLPASQTGHCPTLIQSVTCFYLCHKAPLSLTPSKITVGNLPSAVV